MNGLWLRTHLGVWGAIACTVFLSACGGSGSDEITIPPDAPPREVAEIAGFEGLRSGEAEVSLLLNDLEEKEVVSLRLTGGFEGLGEDSIPLVSSLTVSSNGEWNGRPVDSDASLTVHPRGAQVAYGTASKQQSYEVESATIDDLRSKFEQAHSAKGTGDLGACLEASRGFDLAQLLRDPKIEDRREESDGTKVTVVNGDLVISQLRDLLVRLARDPACAAQMAALGLPPAAVLETAKVDFKKGFGGPHLTLAVDRNGVIRELSTRFECARLNGRVFELELDFGLREVNRSTEVTAERGGEPFDRLLQKLGTTEEAVQRAPGPVAVLAFLEGLGDILTGRPQ